MSSADNYGMPSAFRPAFTTPMRMEGTGVRFS